MSTPRKRIVIDLNNLPKSGSSPLSSRRRKRWPKVLGLLFVALLGGLVALGVAGYFWWNHYKTTPTYSIALALDAAQRNDMPAFDRLIDTDKIGADLVSQITDKVAASPLGLVAGAAIRSQVNALTPQLLPKIKQNFRDQLAEEVKAISSGSSPKPFIVLALTLPSMVKVTTQDNTAHAVVTLREEPVELTMQKDAGFWKVVGVKDNALVSRMVEEVVRQIPAMNPLESAEPRKTVKKRRR